MSTDRFDSTAADYARYRPRYPQAVYDTLADAFALDGSGRLLDVGCGPGEVAIALRERFDAIVGIDVSAEMIAEARRQAEGAGVDAIEWRVMAAEEIGDALGDFRLVVLSDALHWMDQEHVLARCYERVTSGGGIAHLTHGRSIGQTAVAQPWQRTIAETITAWLGPRRRAGTGYYEQPARSDEEMLVDAGFAETRSGSLTFELDWDVDHVLGYLSSTSYAGRQTLGADHERFESDLRERLMRVEPSGRFTTTMEAEWLFGWKR